MKESVSALFVFHDEIFVIKRQNFLSVFPGYHAIPGGKVDDFEISLALTQNLWPKGFDDKVLAALVREVQEEVNYDLLKGVESGEVLNIGYIGTAITPEFNPYRFKNYYFRIELKEKIEFVWDQKEVEFGKWGKAFDFLLEYKKGKMLAVPPMVSLLSALANDTELKCPIDLNYHYDANQEVPVIQSLFGVRQFLPLSQTFPPANRTNAFLIGDDGENKILIDPSPRDEVEFNKFCHSLDKMKGRSGEQKILTHILITHHHPDHYQFSRDLALKYKVSMMMSAYTFSAIQRVEGPEYFLGIEVDLKKEGDIVTRSLGEDVVVYELPGHDEGQIGLAPKNLAWFLVGDLIQTVGTVVIGGPEGDMAKYFSSLKRAIELNPISIIPSHGIIIGGVEKLKLTLKHRQEREKQVAQLQSEGKTIDEMVQILYRDIDPKLHPYGKKTILAHLQKLGLRALN